jgi:hypothetical protein
MIITSNGLATAEAKELTTATTHHFVAAITLDDGHSAIWT